jgi:putative transposase
LDNSYQSFFRRVKQGTEEPGFPKFKKRGEWNSTTFPQYKKLPESKIKVPKVGNVKLVFHRQLPMESKVKTLSIVKDGYKWFACFSIEYSLTIEHKQDLNKSIGIDLGLNDFVYTSSGYSVRAPRYLRKSLDKLAKLQQKFSSTKKRSIKWYKLLKSIQKLHYKIKCQRNDFLHKVSNEILSQADYIAYENLNIKSMTKKGNKQKTGLNKSINDAGWYKFLTLLNYKAIEQGKTIIPVNPAYTSQKCSNCGIIVKKSLSIRTHKCTCGLIINRDHNAAINILTLGLQGLANA